MSRTCCHVHSTQVCVCVCPGWLSRPSLVPSAVLPGHQDRYAQCPRLPGLGSLRTACSWQLCGSFFRCTRARTGVRLRHWLQRSPRRFPLLFHQFCSLLPLLPFFLHVFAAVVVLCVDKSTAAAHVVTSGSCVVNVEVSLERVTGEDRERADGSCVVGAIF